MNKVFLFSFIVLGFLFAPNVFALEFYVATTTSRVTILNGPMESYLQLNIDRTAESDSPDFFVFTNLTGRVDDMSGTSCSCPTAEVNFASSTGSSTIATWEGINADPPKGWELSGNDPEVEGIRFDSVNKITLANETSTLTIAARAETSGENFFAENATIFVLEVPTGSFFSEKTTSDGTGANTDYIDMLTLDINAGTAGDYIVAWGTEWWLEDDNVAAALGVRFVDDTESTVYAHHNTSRVMGADNQEKPSSAAGVAVVHVTANVTTTLSIEADGDGTEDETYTRRATIVAMPTSEFTNVYISSSTTQEFFTGTTFVNSAVTNVTTTNAGNHLVLLGVETSNEANPNAGNFGLLSNGEEHDSYGYTSRDSDLDRYWLGSVFAGGNYPANTTHILRGASDAVSVNGEAVTNRVTLVALEIPDDEEPPEGAPPEERRLLIISLINTLAFNLKYATIKRKLEIYEIL